MNISPKVQGFLDRVTAASDKSTAMRNLSGWLERNTMLNGKPFSFKDHECHIEIAADTHPSLNTKKPSQTGLSELSLRITLALAAVTRSRIIYTLPTATFASKFSKDRIAPVIEESPVLKEMLSSDTKSAEMKKIGNSTLYVVGTFGQTQAISIPAQYLVHDEVDFSNQEVLGTFQSRLRHAEEDPETHIKGHTKRFSTPTVSSYGISKYVEDSDQRFYFVTCSKCNHSFAPSFSRDFVVPGFDDAMFNFSKTDLVNPAYQTSDAYIKCEKCGTDMWQDIMNPDQREWVAKFPHVTQERGYLMSPWDVPKYNSCPSIIKQIKGYTTQDFHNFVLGLDYESKDNSFLKSVFQNTEKSEWVSLTAAKSTDLHNTVIGVDVGKTSWLLVGKQVRVGTKTKMMIIQAVQLRAKVGDALAEQIQKYIDAFNPAAVVIDAAPDFSTAFKLIETNRYGRVFGCEYARTTPGAFTHVAPDPETGVLKAARSGTLSDLMDAHNSNLIVYPEHSEVTIIEEHLGNTKKLKKPSEMGETISFVKTGPDHYAHALNYLNMAQSLVDDNVMLPKVAGALPSVTAVKIGSAAPEIASKPYPY